MATTEPVKLNDTIREFLERDVPVKVTVNGAIGDL